MGQTEKIIAGLEPPALEGLTCAPFPIVEGFTKQAVRASFARRHETMTIVNKNFHSSSSQFIGLAEKLTRANMKQGISSRQFPYAKI